MKKALGKCKSRKPSGKNGIANELLKNCGTPMTQ